MAERMAPPGGLLSGGIGGFAEGMYEVAKLSLEERAEKRKEDYALAVARAKGKGKGSGTEKNPWEIKDSEIKDEEGRTIRKERKYQNPETGESYKAFDVHELAPFEEDLVTLITKYNMSPVEAEQYANKQYEAANKAERVQEGMATFLMKRYNLKQGGTRPKVKSAPTTPTTQPAAKPGSFPRGTFPPLSQNPPGGSQTKPRSIADRSLQTR